MPERITRTPVEGLQRAFGDELRILREEAKLTQDELAYRSDVSRTYISLLERGQRGVSLDVIFALSENLGVQPEEFVRRVHTRLHRRTLALHRVRNGERLDEA